MQVNRRFAPRSHALEKMLDLIDEQLIAVQLLASEAVHHVSLGAIQCDRKLWKVENGFTRVPYHLTLALGWQLQVVLLQVDRQRPSGELALHQCAGGVLDVHLKVTPVSANGE